ncbi:unnamed protein product [Lactuca virosa]|uniref:Uncharacterized protein n=1 Tax=Lactuca virosa TaxID=75947 RepID=A0AAU9P660_9ASTR|nr:unnamed protein product [Lactuca virosa]
MALSCFFNCSVQQNNQGGYVPAIKFKIKEGNSETVCPDSETTNFSLNGEVSKLRDVSKDLHDILAKELQETKVFLQTQIKYIRTLLEYEVKKFAESSTTLHKKLDVVAEATTRLIKDITSFQKDYMVVLQEKTKEDAQDFSKVEEFLTEIKTMLSTQ